jgi:hypothetical protein
MTGSLAICMAPVLSHRRGIRASQEIPKSASNHRNHTTSTVVVANAQSSASVLDRETTACFLDFHARGEEGWDSVESDKIHSNISRIMINKNDIIFVTTLSVF